MAKCVCPPKKGSKPAEKPSKGKPTNGKPAPTKSAPTKSAPKPTKGTSNKPIQKTSGKRHGHPPNMFILYFIDMYRKYGGNMYCVAKECGRRWREGVISDAEKAKYKKAYCAMCKACKSCQAAKKK